jgi:hypothetical protein
MRSPRERGGVLGSILLILGIFCLVAAVAVVAGGLYIARHVHVTASEGKHGGAVSVETPFGSVQVREDSKMDPKRLGVPIYPGAVLRDDKHNLASVELNFGSENKDLAVVAGEYTTPDPIDKVREFYSGELPHWMVSEGSRGDVHFSFTEGGYKRMVILQSRGGLTRIGLAAVGTPAAN